MNVVLIVVALYSGYSLKVTTELYPSYEACYAAIDGIDSAHVFCMDKNLYDVRVK